MITLERLAGIIENGLNAQLNNPEIQFAVWAGAGEEKDAIRTGNTITEYIPGNLSSVSGTNEGNILTMGMNSLLLELGVQIRRPKTNSAQTEEQLARIKNSQYPFISLISAAVDGYFQTAQAFEHIENGVTYSISMVAGRCITGDVDLAAQLGNYVKLSVYIDCYYLQGGVNSRNVALYIDGERIPLLSLSIGRRNMLNNDVYAGELVVKNIASSTAVSIDFTAPATSGNIMKRGLEYLLRGKPNVVHFVKLKYDELDTQMYLAMFDGLTSNAEGASFAGLKGAIIEAADNPFMIDSPQYMQMGRFAFTSSQSESVSFIANGTAYIIGRVVELNGAVNVSLSPSDFVYSQEDNTYYVYMLSLGTMEVKSSSAPFTVIKQAV